jgi:hypothetical protein
VKKYEIRKCDGDVEISNLKHIPRLGDEVNDDDNDNNNNNEEGERPINLESDGFQEDLLFHRNFLVFCVVLSIVPVFIFHFYFVIIFLTQRGKHSVATDHQPGQFRGAAGSAAAVSHRHGNQGLAEPTHW